MLMDKILLKIQKITFDLAEKGSFSTSLVKFDEAMRQTVDGFSRL